MASADVCTLSMIFQVSQVAWPETFKLCYDGISVLICPPELSDLKLWRTAKNHSCWTDQNHLQKYWIYHSYIAFQGSIVDVRCRITVPDSWPFAVTGLASRHQYRQLVFERYGQ